MNNTLVIAKLLSIFANMTGFNKHKPSTESFKMQLENEVRCGNVTRNEQHIVLALLGIERASTIKIEEDPRLLNILNIVELGTSIDMTIAEMYNYINNEFKLGRINAYNRELLLDAFNIKYKDIKETEIKTENGVKYYTLDEIRDHSWTVIVYNGKDRRIENAKQFWSKDASYTFMMQHPSIVKNIKEGNYEIFGEGETIKIRQYYDRDNTPMEKVAMTKTINARIHPMEIAQAEKVLQYVNKYDDHLWFGANIDKDNKVKINIDKNKRIEEAKRTGNIFKMFRR